MLSSCAKYLNSRRLGLFFSVLLLLLTSQLKAQVKVQSNDELWLADETEPEETFEQRFIRSNIAITEWFDGTAEGIDLFLVGKKISKRKNNTHLKVANSTFALDGEGTQNRTSISVDLKLPNLEEYWQLKLSSFDEAEASRSAQTGYLRNTPQETKHGASVGLFRRWGNVRTAFQPRVELTDPLKVSHSLSFESIADFKTFEANPKVEFYATPDKGAGIDTAFNWNFIVTKRVSFTLINNWDYQEKIHTLSAGNGFSFGQLIDRANTMSYGLLFFSNNRDNYHLEGYSFSVGWSHLIYKKILDFQLIPHLDFNRDKDFRGAAGLIFNLNLNF